jgi:hypothetical protein
MSRHRIVRDDGLPDAIAGQLFDSYDAAHAVLERYYDDLCCSDDREYYRIEELSGGGEQADGQPTFHNASNGLCVLRIKARGHRELVTVVGHAAEISAGEWITVSGVWSGSAGPLHRATGLRLHDPQEPGQRIPRRGDPAAASPPVYVSGVDWGLPGFGDTQITKNLQQLLAAGRTPH